MHQNWEEEQLGITTGSRGKSGEYRSSGGGSAGTVYNYANTNGSTVSGAGADGNSYGGGLPGGCVSNYQNWNNITGENGGKDGAKYNRLTYTLSDGLHRGESRIHSGGLLICYGMNINGTGQFSSNGGSGYYYEPNAKVNIEGGASGRRFS